MEDYSVDNSDHYAYCPECGAKLDFGMPMQDTYEGTTYCAGCGILLQSLPFGLVKFKEYLEYTDKRWHAAGKAVMKEPPQTLN